MALQNITKIAIGWSIATGVGIYTFIVARRNVSQRRIESMKIKRSMQNQNTDN